MAGARSSRCSKSAPTINEALDAMVADRRTDETLEQIEHGAAADGAWWPDL
jgi:hypothetical protein